MAKFLAYERNNQEVVVFDTVQETLTNLGGAVPLSSTTAVSDTRMRNVVSVFRGDPFVAMLTNTNQVEVFQLSGGTWSLVHGPISPVSGGVMGIAGLHVVNDTLMLVMLESSGAPVSTRYLVSLTTDGAAWSDFASPGITGVIGAAAPAFVWRQAVFVGGDLGIWAIDTGGNFLTGAPDTGDDGGIVKSGPVTPSNGCFASWNDDLYYLLQDDQSSGAQLYKLDPTWDVSAPTPIPAWTNQNATGIPDAPGALGGTSRSYPLLFKNVKDELCILHGGASGETYLVKTSGSTFPAFTDETALLPELYKDLTQPQIALYEDDRRRTNPRQFIWFRDESTLSVHISEWDGESPFVVGATISGSLILFSPNEPRGDYRTFTDLQPAVFWNGAPVENFPGQYTLSYTVRDSSSRLITISPEYSTDGDEWSPMTEGDGGDGVSDLASSPAGVSHTFIWDAFIDLSGTVPNMQMRIVPRISGV